MSISGKGSPDPDAARRSAIMRAVKSHDTGPERVVRKLVHPLAPGYRLHRRDIPGRPDIAWIGAKRAIFVHGCFWHGHDCARGARVPKTNRAYWLAKIARNAARDAAHRKALRKLGWRVLTVWECDLRRPAALRRRLGRFLSP